MEMNVVVDDEFRALIPPLRKDEFAQLQANIIADGCRDPLVVWLSKPEKHCHKCYEEPSHSGNLCNLVVGDGVWFCTHCEHNPELLEYVLVDGHNRLDICTKNKIDFDVFEMDFSSRTEAKIWILRNQLGRRNLNDFQHTETALQLKPLIEEQARANQGERTDIRQNSDEGYLAPTPIRTDETIANMAGVSRDTVRKVENIKANAEPEIIDAVRSGSISINLASQVADLPPEEQAVVASAAPEEIKDIARGVIHNHRAQGTGENEWYTPAQYIDAARDVLGGIDLDPASSAIAQETVKAANFLTVDDDGLKHDWNGRVWLNPPYAQPAIQHFMQKTVDEYQSGRMLEGIALTHNYTDTQWFHVAARVADAICFTRGRIGFLSPDGKKAAPTQGQAFFYFGKRREDFADTFCRFGFVVVRP